MKSLVDIFSKCRSGVAKVVAETSERDKVGTGSAFLVDGGVITNSHVIRHPACAVLELQFEGASSPIRVVPDDAVKAESPMNEKDYVFLGMDEPEFDNRFRFRLNPDEDISVGQQVAFMGYPFGMPNLTSHLGYISSIHMQSEVDVIQIDGSVNGGNSGGPLLSLVTGDVVGIVTRAHTGLIEDQFQQLLEVFARNRQQLDRVQGGISIGGVDPVQAHKVTNHIMEKLARDLHRSANVGIGYAFSIKHAAEKLAEM